jgi:hypothetical protein
VKAASWWLICAAAFLFVVVAAGNAWFDRTEVRQNLKSKSGKEGEGK